MEIIGEKMCFVKGRNSSSGKKSKNLVQQFLKHLDLQKILNETIHVLKELMDVGNIYICMQDAPGQPYRGFASDQPLNDLAFSLGGGKSDDPVAVSS